MQGEGRRSPGRKPQTERSKDAAKNRHKKRGPLTGKKMDLSNRNALKHFGTTSATRPDTLVYHVFGLNNKGQQPERSIFL